MAPYAAVAVAAAAAAAAAAVLSKINALFIVVLSHETDIVLVLLQQLTTFSLLHAAATATATATAAATAAAAAQQ